MADIYRKITSVDIGSTNSQIAQRYEVSSDDGASWRSVVNSADGSDYFLKVNGNVNYPSMVICRDELPEGSTYSMEQESISGENAWKVHNDHFNIPLRMEFKKNLYYSAEEISADPEKRRDFELAKKYTKFLLKDLKTREGNQQSYSPVTEEKTYITVPVRATTGHKALMREIADSVGWKNVEILDETDGVLNYTFSPGVADAILTKLGENTVISGLKILIIDIGGSTADMLLVEVRPDGYGSFVCERLGIWPDIGATETLGGIDVDKSLEQWLLKNKFILEGPTKKDEEKNGYTSFRQYKEKISDTFKNPNSNEIADLYGPVANLCMDRKTRTFAEVTYQESEKKITREVFANEIIRNYASKLSRAVRKLLMDCLVDEADIDGIILAGGGAQMYGIRELFMGTLPTDDDPLDFKKIKENNKLLVTLDKYSSGICALGNVLPKSKIPYRKHCLSDYILNCSLYTATAGEDVNSWMFRSFEEDPTIPDNLVSVLKKEWLLAKENEPLPITNLSCQYTGEISVDKGKALVMVLRIRSEKGNTGNFQRGWSRSCYRNLSEWVKQLTGRAYEPKRNVTVRIGVEISENMLIKLVPYIAVERFWSPGNGKTLEAMV